MDPQFRSRLIAAIILIIVVCSAFSVSQVAGLRLENRDGDSSDAILAGALVLQQSTRIREEFMDNLTVYIDSDSVVFRQRNVSGDADAVYVPEENAIYIRPGRNTTRVDEAFTRQVGHRVYRTGEFYGSRIAPSLETDLAPCLSGITAIPGEEREAALFAGAFMLYHTTPALLEKEAPAVYAYMDLLATNGGDRETVDDLYSRTPQE